MYDALHDALHSLQAAGARGFEGLVHAHIGRLTGRRFFLAKSGTQAGKDVSTAGYGGTYIDIECKRYRRGMSPTTRDLIGGFIEAFDASAGNLDLWLVVSTGAIGSSEAEALRRTADREAVAVEIIDWQEAGLPELAVLCAAFSRETVEVLQVRGVSGDLTAVSADLMAVADDPRFPTQLADLRRRLSAADLGLDHAREVTNAWVQSRLLRKADAMAAFHQALCVGDVGFQPYIERPVPQAALSAWYAAWPDHHSLAAVLGREGNGKSWATMAWWKGLTGKPLTLVLTSNRVTANDSMSIVASVLLEQAGVRDVAFWKRRLQQWLQRPPSGVPTILLILDGLNERPRQPWDQFFASLNESGWAGRLAVVITCRPAFWSERVAHFLPDGLPVTCIEVQPFNDEELANAWGDRRPTLSEMPKPVRDFIRTPRIFRLARNHIEDLIQSGDLTVERLLIEDWADRRQLRLGFAHSVPDFNNLVIELARDLRQGVGEFGRHRLREYSSLARRNPDRNLDKDFDEIIDGRLFERIDPVSDKHRVRPEYVGLALGMLLAREARDANRHLGTAGIEGVLAEALDPVADLDQTTATLRGACAVAFLEAEYPVEARRALLRTWLCRQNPDEAQWHDFAAYVPLHPKTFFDLADDFWFGADIYPTAREWVADAILRWRGLPAVQALIEARCARWLGLWHRDWHGFVGKPDTNRLARQRATVVENWSRLTDSERRLADELLSEAQTPHAPSIARLALLLASHGPRLKHVRGLVAWALSRAIMQSGDQSEEVAWCLRLNRHDPTETEAALLVDVGSFLEDRSEVGTRAARTLLWACGTPAAAERRSALPAPPQHDFWFLQQRLIDVDPLDPATRAPTDLTPVTERLAALDPAEFCRTLSRTAEEHDFAQIEPTLVRFEPALASAFCRRLLQSARDRQGIRLRQLGWRIPEYLMLISPEEADALDQARCSLLPLLGDNPHDAQATEAYLLVGVLGNHTVGQQLDLLLARPPAALDLLLLEEVLVPVQGEMANVRLILAETDWQPHVLRRLLWVLSRNAFPLNAAARMAVVRCFSHGDPAVRASAFRLAMICDDRMALRVHAASEWRARSDDSTLESFYGSLALIAGTDPIDYIALRGRVAPELLGYLAVRDGRPHAIDAFAQDLDALWETMATPISAAEIPSLAVTSRQPNDPSTPELEITDIAPLAETALRTIHAFGRGPSAEELKSFFEWSDPDRWIHERREFNERIGKLIAEAQRVGRHFFGKGMRGYGLSEVISRHRELVEKWITALAQRDRVQWDAAEFHRALCAGLGQTDPDRAADILVHLQHASTVLRITYRPWNIDSLAWLAFKLPSNPKVDAVRERLLEDACTDELLFQVALAAQANGATGWLGRVIQRDFDATAVYRRARALTLIGFLDEGGVLDALRQQLNGRAGFLKDVAMCAQDRLEKNHRARAWFTKFISHRDEVEAWAAFRLFLRCVDRRFHLWENAMLNATHDLPLLWRQHVTVNDWNIRKTAEDNEGRLSEILFGLRIPKGEIAPWYGTPPMADPACSTGGATGLGSPLIEWV